MFSNFVHRINQKWDEFLYSPVCSQLKDFFSDCGHIVENPTKLTVNQPTEIDLQERFKICKKKTFGAFKLYQII